MNSSDDVQMRGWRRMVVNGLIGGFLGLFVVTIRHEQWPICNYPMFARLSVAKEGSIPHYVVVQGGREVELFPGHHSIAINVLQFGLARVPNGHAWQS